MNAKKKTKKKAIITAILALAGVLLLGGGIIGYKYYSKIYNVNVELGSKDNTYLYIPTGSEFNDVVQLLTKEDILIDAQSFKWLAEKKGYTTSVKSGRYLLTNHMTNNALINLLRSGRQEPIKFTFNSFRTRAQLAGKAGKLLETDSTAIAALLYDDSTLQERYQMNGYEIMCVFIPNTYEIYWNTSATEFVDRMHKEYLKFWNDSRKEKAAKMELSPEQVVTLASIVTQESNKIDEISRLAGVYVNRLQTGMMLQACPTAIYASGDFTLTRVLKRHTEIESPYNTYIHQGLPPGPICTPSGAVIDKVLDYEEHDYLFFCAKEDFSGYHNFAKTNAQHEQNAARYHQAYLEWARKKKNKK